MPDVTGGSADRDAAAPAETTTTEAPAADASTSADQPEDTGESTPSS